MERVGWAAGKRNGVTSKLRKHSPTTRRGEQALGELSRQAWQAALLVSASDHENANKRSGRRIDAYGRSRTAGRNSRRPGK